MRSRRWVWLGLFILGGLGLLGYRAVTQSLGITTGTSRNEVFYRFTASYTVDKTETVSMDVVVACNVEVTGYKFGGSSWRTNRTPTHYPIVTRSRHVVLVQVPDACDWVMRDKHFSRDIFPFVQFIESVDNLRFGIGYLTEDAYASPLSRLNFLGAHLQAADRREWGNWRDEAARGFTASPTIPEPWGYGDRELNGSMPPDRTRTFSRPCWAMARFQFPQSFRPWIHSLWPANRPDYWYINSRDGARVRTELQNKILLDRSITFYGWPFLDYEIHDSSTLYARGLRRGRSDDREGVSGRKPRPVPELYPELRSNRYDQWSDSKVAKNKTVWQLDYQPEKRGFAYCYTNGSPDGFAAYIADLTSKPVEVRVSGDLVDINQKERFGTAGLTDATDLVGNGAWIIIEGDEYFFTEASVQF